MKIYELSIDKVRLPKLKKGVRLLLYFITLLFSILSIVEALNGYFYIAVDIIIYVIAAAGIFLSSHYLISDFTYGVRFKLKPIVEGNAFTKRVYKDYRYRTILSTYFAFFVNLFYAVINGIFGFINHSPWFGSLAAYYIILCVMRFSTVWYERKILKSNDDKSKTIHELIVYRNCGILLIVITIAFGGAVIMLMHKEGGKSYPGFLIFAVAAYTFYKVIISIKNIIKTKKFKSPLLATIRNIGYTDALVSLLSLQTAMFFSFGKQGKLDYPLMNGLTGTAICIMILFIGIYMIYNSKTLMRLVVQEEKGQEF